MPTIYHAYNAYGADPDIANGLEMKAKCVGLFIELANNFRLVKFEPHANFLHISCFPYLSMVLFMAIVNSPVAGD